MAVFSQRPDCIFGSVDLCKHRHSEREGRAGSNTASGCEMNSTSFLPQPSLSCSLSFSFYLSLWFVLSCISTAVSRQLLPDMHLKENSVQSTFSLQKVWLPINSWNDSYLFFTPNFTPFPKPMFWTA